MEQLLIVTLAGAVVVAFAMRKAISPAVARWIGVASALGLLASLGGLSLLLVGRFAPPHSQLAGSALTGLLVASLCAAPFALLPLLAGRRR